MSAGVVRERPPRSLPSVEDDACLQSRSSPPTRAIRLPSPADLAGVPLEEVPSLITQLAALVAALAPRLAVPSSSPQAGRLSTGTGNYVTAKEVAEVMRLTTARVYELARTRRIPVKRVGDRQLRFDLAAVREALG